MIGAKKRFSILQRDGFRCSYCGKNGKDVTLEVDHIIPKSDGGSDDMENLTTCCRECNIGKGKLTIEEHSKDIYKHKLKDAVKEVKDYIYFLWNNKYKLGLIDHRTVSLISIYASNSIMGEDGNYYQKYLDYPPLYSEGSIYGSNCKEVDFEKMDTLFKKGGQFCTDLLSCIISDTKIDIEYFFEEEILNDDIWTNKKAGLNTRLNYCLGFLLKGQVSDYVLLKYVLNRKAVMNG